MTPSDNGKVKQVPIERWEVLPAAKPSDAKVRFSGPAPVPSQARRRKPGSQFGLVWRTKLEHGALGPDEAQPGLQLAGEPVRPVVIAFELLISPWELNTMQSLVPRRKIRKGFTLVELAVVIVIIGVLAAFGVPKFLASVEKSKATESFNFWSAVQAAEERYIAQNGQYATVTDATAAASSSGNPLDIVLPTLQYFNFTNLTPTADSAGNPTWTGTLTRNANSSYSYTVVWTQNGFDTTNSTIMTYPAICPVTYATTGS